MGGGGSERLVGWASFTAVKLAGGVGASTVGRGGRMVVLFYGRKTPQPPKTSSSFSSLLLQGCQSG